MPQMRRIEWHFPRSHGVPRVDDRRIASGIIFVIITSWSRLGAFADIRRIGGTFMSEICIAAAVIFSL